MRAVERDIDQKLIEWKNSPRRKPLILEGARQVGKTYALTHFGKTSYEKMVYFNFEKEESLADYFKPTLDPAALIKILEIHKNTDITPHNTLIIFDEIQECPRALNSLKYFCETASDYHVVAAGSLLGIKLANEKGFPVGKVNFLTLYPLSFFEFLSALDQEKLRHFLEGLVQFDPLPEPIHENLLRILKTYFYVGGMPEAVGEFAKNQKLNSVREIQSEILNAYERDFAKHAPPSQVMKITTVWNQIHRQLGKENKKFLFSLIRKSARSREYEEAIQWLNDAGLIYKCTCVETPKFPLSAYADTDTFKVYLFDVGLLGAQSSLAPQTVIEGNELFTEFKGALTENFVAQELKVSLRQRHYYWTSAGTAEVDFLVEGENTVIPLEVKAGATQKKKSLLVYGEKYKPSTLCRTTLMNLKSDGDLRNFPLYLISRLIQIRSTQNAP